MKLRIYRNSLRLRLSPADVNRLQQRGSIADKLCFSPTSEFSYGIRLLPDISAMRAQFNDNSLYVDVPNSLAQSWAESEAISLSAMQQTGQEKTLKILIEKDFECLEGDASDSGEIFYPNPNKTCV